MPRAQVGLSGATPLRDEVDLLRAQLEAVALLDAASGVAGLVEAAHRLLGKPVAFVDTAGRVVSCAPRGAPGLPGLELLQSVGEVATTVLLPAGRSGALSRRHLVRPVAGEGSGQGWVVVQERGRSLTEFDAMALEHLVPRLARELRTHRRIAALAANARSHLTRQLIRGTADRADLRATGEHLGVDVDLNRIVVVVLAEGHDASRLDLAEWERALSVRLSVEVLATRGSEGLLLLVESAPTIPGAQQVAAVRAALHGTMAETGAAHLVAGIGSPVSPESLGTAYREAREVALSARRLDQPGRILTVEDLGPLRVLLAHLDPEPLRQHAASRLQPLLDNGQGELVDTLATWFEHDHRVRPTANALGVHENTVRLRLERVHELTGVDPLRAAGQLDLHMSLLILRLLDGARR